MFTGIIETLGVIEQIEKRGQNLDFVVSSAISNELKIDQSVSHDGVCLTVIARGEGHHRVTAVHETLLRTTLASWKVGKKINLERATAQNARLDGHIVQGHVDAVGKCVAIEPQNGSWQFLFQYMPTDEHLLVDKCSVAINGVSLTVVSPKEDLFSVAIIPYTFSHTTFQNIHIGDAINLEFDILGKYIARYAKHYFSIYQQP